MAAALNGPDQRVLAAALTLLPREGTVLTPSAAVGEALAGAGVTVIVADLGSAASQPATAAIALLDDELSDAGEHAEGLLAAAVDLVQPGGVIAVCVRSAVTARVNATTSVGRAFHAAEIAGVLGHRGVNVELLCSPGAAARLRGDEDGAYDAELDRLPGLLDAGPRVLAVGTTPRTMADRSREFFNSLPYKVVAAAVMCRDDQDRLLVVHDSFKGHWTIPGGVVDADEDPRAAAEREAWEEAGVRVTADRVLGVFSASWPDRVVLVYEATAEDGRVGQPIHAHEIDAVDWWPLDRALRRLAPHVAEQVRHCLEHPGRSLRQERA